MDAGGAPDCKAGSEQGDRTVLTHLRRGPATLRQRLSYWPKLFISIVVPAVLLAAGCGGSGGSSDRSWISSLSASPSQIPEGGGVVTLSAQLKGTPSAFDWEQVSGPSVTLTPVSATQARVDVTDLSVASNVELRFALSVTRHGTSDSREVGVLVVPITLDDALGANGHIGGSIDHIARFDSGGTTWIAYNVGSSLVTTAPGNGGVSAPRYRIDLPGIIRGIRTVLLGGRQRIALVAMGRFGVAAVDLTVPSAPALLASAPIAIDHTVPMTVDTGGNDYPDFEINGPGDIVALATDGTSVWLADERFGIHRVALSTLLDPGSRLDDGSLPIENEIFTLNVSEEDVYWGKPTDLRLYSGTLFATLGVAGLVMHDPITLARTGAYNLYRDTSMTENRFYGADLTSEVQSDLSGPYIDSKTGLPDYRQA